MRIESGGAVFREPSESSNESKENTTQSIAPVERLAPTADSNTMRAKAGDSVRFAVLVPWPDEVDLSAQQSNSTAPTQPKPQKMALLNNAWSLFKIKSPDNIQQQPMTPKVCSNLSASIEESEDSTACRPVDSVRLTESASQALYRGQLALDPNYLSRTTKGAKQIFLDDCVDICFMPNRTGTRGPSAEMTAAGPNATDLTKLLALPKEAIEPTGRLVPDDHAAHNVEGLGHQMRLEPTHENDKVAGCFMCHPDAGQIVVMDREFRVRAPLVDGVATDTGVMMTLNKKPYTDKEHLLIFPTAHLPQAYNSDLFTYSLGLLAEAKVGSQLIMSETASDTHNYTVLFAGPVGGSQSHHHQHLINKKTNLQSYIEANPQSIRPIVFDDKANNGVFRVTSEPLKSFESNEVFNDPKRGPLHFFDCLMVKGDADYVEAQTSRIIEHLNEQQADGSVRARYNMAMLPIDDAGNYRSVIFPRSTADGTDQVERPILWRDKKFPPSAHEMCGHWFMTKLPKNNEPSTDKEFEYKVLRAIYKVAHDVRAPIDSLGIEAIFTENPTQKCA